MCLNNQWAIDESTATVRLSPIKNAETLVGSSAGIITSTLQSLFFWSSVRSLNIIDILLICDRFRSHDQA